MKNLEKAAKQPTVSDCLNYLEEIGWSDLIDGRFSEEVVNDLKMGFVGISDEMIEKVLKIVIVDEN